MSGYIFISMESFYERQSSSSTFYRNMYRYKCTENLPRKLIFSKSSYEIDLDKGKEEEYEEEEEKEPFE